MDKNVNKIFVRNQVDRKLKQSFVLKIIRKTKSKRALSLLKKYKNSKVNEFYTEIKKRSQSFKNQVRRRYLYIFHKERVMESLETRLGECSSCGQCCITTYQCPFAFIKNNLVYCKIHERKFHMCKLYPFDSSDKFDHTKNTCTFYFPDELEGLTENQKKKFLIDNAKKIEESKKIEW